MKFNSEKFSSYKKSEKNFTFQDKKNVHLLNKHELMKYLYIFTIKYEESQKFLSTLRIFWNF